MASPESNESGQNGAAGNATLTVRDLRRRWKPQKERLQLIRSDHPTNVRIHRACSWLQRVETIADDADLDLALTNQWIAFNSLYGVWDAAALQPAGDRDCWREFLVRILRLDTGGSFASLLQTHKKLVMSILDDEYLSGFFWKEPTRAAAGKARKLKFVAQSWYVDRNWASILERLVDRIYLLRCQLVHGAATYNSKLNRRALKRCSMMLGYLLTAVLIVIADHGANEDWGPMCYPPLSAK